MMTARRFGIPAMVLVAAVLGGCASSAPQYYSLQAADSTQSPGSPTVDSSYAINVQPVVIPQQVARPQIVVRASPSAEVVPLNSALWAGPLEAQIRNAFAEELAHRLNVLDVGRSGAADALPVWRIYIDVQRFDSFYDAEVQQELVWRMVPQGMLRGVKERLCSAQVRLPVGTGMAALVEGHRQALAALAAVMAQTLPGPKSASPDIAAIRGTDGVVLKGCVG